MRSIQPTCGIHAQKADGKENVLLWGIWEVKGSGAGGENGHVTVEEIVDDLKAGRTLAFCQVGRSLQCAAFQVERFRPTRMDITSVTIASISRGI